MTGLPAELAVYQSWVFDCDGVLLGSNGVKTEAFRAAAKPYGDAAAQALVDYHRAHGGISRFVKADYLFRSILGRDPEPGETDAFLARFAQAARSGLATCAQAPGLLALLKAIPFGVAKSVVSGSEQAELRTVLKARGLGVHFDAILGSPASKHDNLTGLRGRNLLSSPGLFVGDSREDYEAAQAAGLDFIFLHGWTAFDGWRDYFSGKSIRVAADIESLPAAFAS